MTTHAPVQAKQQAEGNRTAQSTHPQRAQQGVGLNADFMALQRSAGNSAVNNVIPSLGGGSPLPIGLRGEMEQRFGEDFSNVRMHTDARAAQSAEDLSAKAYTYGDNIVFNKGRFTPESTEGKRLLAHELAHVVQQQRGGTAPLLDVNAPHEQAAENAAKAAVLGLGWVNVAGATGVGLAREPDVEVEDAVKGWATPSPLFSGKPGQPDPGDISLDLAKQEARLRVLGKQVEAFPTKETKEEYAQLLERYNARVTAIEEQKWSAVMQGQPKMTSKDMYAKLVAMRSFEHSLAGHELKAAQAQLAELGIELKQKPTLKLRRQYNRLRDSILISKLGTKGAPAGAGYNTYAMVQVVGADGKIIAVAVGKYTGGQHAEEIAIAKLERQFGKTAFPGAEIVVVGDKVVCPDVCRPALEKFAVKLQAKRVEGQVFRRAKLIGEGEASEKTTARTATADLGQSEIGKPAKLRRHAKVLYKDKTTVATPAKIPAASLGKAPALAPDSILGPPLEPGGILQEPAPKVSESASSAPPSSLESVAKTKPPAASAPIVRSPLGKRVILEPSLEKPLRRPSWREKGADKMWSREAFRRNNQITQNHKYIASQRADAAAFIGEKLGNALENLNEWGIQNSIEKELAKLKPTIKAYQEIHQNDGVLIAVQIETWDSVWRPTEARPTRSFISLVPEYGGKTKDEAIDRWLTEPKFLPGPSEGSTIGTDFIWIPPGKYVSLSKTNFINGRYVSSSDPTRMLAFQFEDNGIFHCDATDLRSGSRLRVEVVSGWQLNINENSLKMIAKFYDTGNQAIIESEFRVIDGGWVHEYWKTNTGTSGDNLWQKTEF